MYQTFMVKEEMQANALALVEECIEEYSVMPTLTQISDILFHLIFNKLYFYAYYKTFSLIFVA